MEFCFEYINSGIQLSKPGRFPGIKEITEMTENFTKVTRYLTKFKKH